MNHQLRLNPREKRIKAGLEQGARHYLTTLGNKWKRQRDASASVGSASAGGPENSETEGLKEGAGAAAESGPTLWSRRATVKSHVPRTQCPLPKALCNNSQFLLEPTILALTLKGQVEMPAACFHHCTPTCSSCVRSSRGAAILRATLIQHLIYKHCHEWSYMIMSVYRAFLWVFMSETSFINGAFSVY